MSVSVGVGVRRYVLWSGHGGLPPGLVIGSELVSGTFLEVVNSKRGQRTWSRESQVSSFTWGRVRRQTRPTCHFDPALCSSSISRSLRPERAEGVFCCIASFPADLNDRR
jgi:hypothetical protein